jgi:hypothetical protein
MVKGPGQMAAARAGVCQEYYNCYIAIIYMQHNNYYNIMTL